MTEAYFGVNDFFPFNRAELKEAEPEIHALLREIWESPRTIAKTDKTAGSVVNGLQLSLSADRTETFISKDGKIDKPISFRLTFTNVSDKPIKFNAFDYAFSRVKGEVKAQSADSLKFSLYGPGRKKLIPQAGDFPEIKPGQTWSHAKIYEFPGTIVAGSSMFARYAVLKPGEFRVSFFYNSPREDSPFAKDMWIGELVSNEVVIAVKAEAPPTE